MKKLLSILAAILISAGLYSQAPDKFSYQSVVRNSSGALIQKSNVGIRITLIQGSATGNEVYSETHTVTTNANGLATTSIGAGMPLFGKFQAIDWANGPYYIRTETDPSGGIDYTISGTSELLSVPYALFSANGTPGPPGILTPGTSEGNTPFWNGAEWVTNSSNIYNNGGNIGIGTTAPGFPLNFPNSLGDKIALWGNSGNHYGFGIQSGLLQVHTDAPAANISFGYGSSSAFTERVTIINAGTDGMVVSGRLHLKNGTVPNDIYQTPGVWLYKADNSGVLSFMGSQNNQSVGFYGGAAGWGFTYDAINSWVGIGNQNPNAPLSFAASLGKKITLYPGNTGDAGFGMDGNRLQIFSDNPNADVAIGYDAAGTFNERFAIKPTGALAVNGNVGSQGQVLQSNGGNSAATWVSKPYAISFYQSGVAELAGQPSNSVAIPGLANQGFTLLQTSTIVFNSSMNAYSISLINMAYCYSEVQIVDAGGQIVASSRAYESLPSYRKINLNTTGMATLAPGFYTTRFVLARLDALSGGARSDSEGALIIQVFPQ